MSGPILGRTNKVTVGQEFFSLPILAERISKLESQIAELLVKAEERETGYDELIKLVQELTKKHNQHLVMGHKDGKK
jgi:uncharacterized protein YigA (DUF484 family)